MLDKAVVAVTVVGLASISYLTALYLDLALANDIILLPTIIYPLLPTTYSFNLNLETVPVPDSSLDRHQSLDHTRFIPLLGLTDGFVLPPGSQSYQVAHGYRYGGEANKREEHE